MGVKLVNRLGIPMEEVGQRLKELNESLKAHGMALTVESGVKAVFGKEEKATFLELTVALFERPLEESHG